MLGLYQVVDPKWNFVASCDWQCRPQDEQTTVTSEQPTQAEPAQSQSLDEKDAQIGLYQIVDPRWYFSVTCDWQCRPEGEELPPLPEQELPLQELPPQQGIPGQELDQQEVAPQPPARTKCNVPLSESDALIGLYQMVDHRWEYLVSCEWQCKPSRTRRSTARQTAVRQPSARAPSARESAVRESSARESGARQSALRESGARESALRESSARESTLRDSTARPSADRQAGLSPRESGARESSLRESTAPRESALRESTLRESGVRGLQGLSTVIGDTDSVPLSEAEARLGLYQMVNPRWDYVVSCDWQCRPPGEKVYNEQVIVDVESGVAVELESGVVESGGGPLSESEARVGLYQLVNARWGWVVSCDWQCRLLGESTDYDDRYSQPAVSERLEGSEMGDAGMYCRVKWLICRKCVVMQGLSKSVLSSSRCTKTRFRPGLCPGPLWGSF